MFNCFPSKNRPELVARIRAAGLTQKEIADTAGVSLDSIKRDLKGADAPLSNAAITNSRGQQRPATYQRADDDIVDAEIVEDEPAHVNRETGEILAGLSSARVPSSLLPGARGRYMTIVPK